MEKRELLKLSYIWFESEDLMLEKYSKDSIKLIAVTNDESGIEIMLFLHSHILPSRDKLLACPYRE